MKRILITIVLMCYCATAHASTPEQFQFPITIGKGIAGTILIVGWPRDKAKLGELVKMVTEHANKAYEALDARNPRSDIAKLNTSAGTGPQPVGWQTTECLVKAMQLSTWTGVDVLAAPGSRGVPRDIIIDEAARTAELAKPGMKISIEPVLEGYLADLMSRFVLASGMTNALVNVGTVYRGIGQSLHGQWKIEIREDSTTYAKHAMNISASDMGIAIAGKATSGKNRCKGVTIALGDAAQAQGLAGIIMEAGPQEGAEILKKVPGARGLIIDTSGTFTRVGL